MSAPNCPALTNLFGAVGHGLRPKVLCLPEGANQDTCHADYSVYSENQLQTGRPRERHWIWLRTDGWACKQAARP